ncbi:MAG: energy-coupling factor transporter ATPase [Bacilli bacterium]|jgi:energy-coupling factor transport system ATP-binding protein
MIAISVENISFSFDGKKNAVDHVSFDVESGRYVSIIGHNGSGKSTLARLLTGLIYSKKGSIKIFDRELNDKTIGELRKYLGIVFQNPDNQFIGATVRDDLAFGLENKCTPHGEMDRIIVDYAKKVDMEKFLDKEPSALSGGQKQRVAIAGILSMHPDIVIFDEATSMLDPKARSEIRELIKTMREDNPKLTILSITHDIEEAVLSDEIIVMSEGKVYLKGTPEEVFSSNQKLEEIRLDLPFFYRLKSALIDSGIDMSEAKTVQDLVDIVCR